MNKGTILWLAMLAALCGGSWMRSEAKQAAKERERLDAPFREYQEKHGPNLKYGQTAPDFTLKDETGKSYRLSDVCKKAKLTLVSGVRPSEDSSIRQLIDLREAYLDLHPKGLEVVALCRGSVATVEEMKRQYAVPFPILLDEGEQTLKKLGAVEEPYALLLSPQRKVVFSVSGYQAPLGLNELADKATLELIGRRLDRNMEFGIPTASPLSSKQPLVLNDLDGNPVRLPFSRATVIVVTSVKCPACSDSFERLSRAWKVSGCKTPVAVVFANPPALARDWLEEQHQTLPGARFLCDPSDLTRRKLGLTFYGGAALLDIEGNVLARANYGGKDGSYSLERLFSDQGGEARHLYRHL
jgi:peroxiredoxin